MTARRKCKVKGNRESHAGEQRAEQDAANACGPIPYSLTLYTRDNALFVDAFDKEMAMTDPLDYWREYLDPTPFLDDPLWRPGSTLMAVANKLAAVTTMLGTLDADHPDETEIGLGVANMAAAYGLAVLAAFGVVDGDEPVPPILNFKMAQVGVGNLLRHVEFQIDLLRDAVRQEDAQNDTAPAAPSPSSGLVIDRDKFEISYKGKSCELGNTLSFRLLERFSQARGVFLTIKILIDDVWKGKEVSDEAVQRQVSILRDKLKNAGIDGIEFEAQPDVYRMILR